MRQEFKDVASRIRSLREDCGVSLGEMAESVGVGRERYAGFESGAVDIPASILSEIAVRLKVDLGLLMTGVAPKMSLFSVTRRGRGTMFEQRGSYRYENFAASFKDAQFEPFIVTQSLSSQEEPPVRHAHPGQEFNYLLAGKMRFCIGDKTFILEAGDSVIFDSSEPHSLEALDGDVKFLAVITV